MLSRNFGAREPQLGAMTISDTPSFNPQSMSSSLITFSMATSSTDKKSKVALTTRPWLASTHVLICSAECTAFYNCWLHRRCCRNRYVIKSNRCSLYFKLIFTFNSYHVPSRMYVSRSCINGAPIDSLPQSQKHGLNSTDVYQTGKSLDGLHSGRHGMQDVRP